jgi:predicted nucleic acid-binding protein
VIILDTNVISELIRSAPDARVKQWTDEQVVTDLHLTSITVAELGYGVARLSPGRRRDDLARRIDGLMVRLFTERVLSFDQAAAEFYGGVAVVRERVGRPIDIPDAQIASVCLQRGAVLATRNVRDFEGLGLTLIDPWQG